jgi:Asp-tRNA(Asn)/Glu-tRNA(Gln) amidotransferase A subunit family amidase
VAAKRISAREVVQQYLDRISRTEDAVKSFITVDVEGALRQVGVFSWLLPLKAPAKI